MSTGNGSAAPQLGVLAEISARLAAITPEQFIAPNAKDDGGTPVCVATDDIKRLYTLRILLGKEMEELSRSGFRVCVDALNDIAEKGIAAIADELLSPEGRAKKMEGEIRENNRILRQKNALAEIVDNIFWLEVDRQHPTLGDNQVIGINSDWSLCWREDDDEPDFSRLASLLARLPTRSILA